MPYLFLTRRLTIFSSLCIVLAMNMHCFAEITPENALASYIAKDDGAFAWEVKNKATSDGVTLYDILLTSQEWKTGKWTHQLRVVVPEKRNPVNAALLFITGGSNKDGMPNWKSPDQDELQMLGRVAKGTGAPVAVLNQVPNQPHYGDRTEDDLISYTFVQYLESKDMEWPLLFPMTKSAVRAMDAIQEFGNKELDWNIEQFVVSGGSKRGWTTWLTGAHDDRVAAIAPMVIDVLNMREQMAYQLDAWGKYSPQIQDYETKEFQGSNLLEIVRKGDMGQDLLTMVDPYSYIGGLTIPKLIFIGTNDPYWPADAIKFYYDDLEGSDNYIHYVPNAGHGLGDGKQAIRALAGFFGHVLKGEDHPSLTWSSYGGDGVYTIEATAGDDFVEGHVWVATSEDRDFRDSEFASFPAIVNGNRITASVPLPRNGYVATYVDAEFKSPVEKTYTKSTRMFLLSPKGVIK